MAKSIDRELVHEVAAWAESRLEDPFSLEGLSELEADVLGTITAIGVIGNGGFVYWYEGKDRDQTLGIAASFDRMGLAAAGAAMRQSLTAFPEDAPPQDLGERQEYVSNHRKELEERFDSLDHTIWDTEHDLAAARYVSRRRRELLALDPGFGPLLQQFDAVDRNRTNRLRAAVATLPSAARIHCERAIDSEDLTAAVDHAVSAGESQDSAFWSALEEVARALGHDARANQCGWWSRIASHGALVVAAEFVPESGPEDADRRVHRTGNDVSWNVGPEPAGMFRARRAKLFFAARGWVRPGEACQVFLVPGDASTAPGSAVVLHDRGEVIGRGRVAERREPRKRSAVGSSL